VQRSFHTLCIRWPGNTTERSNFTHAEWRANIGSLRDQCNASGTLRRTERVDRFAINEY
jgi:hypothetical protein